MSTPCLIAIILLVAIIIVGLKFNINLGVLGLAAAYICGTFIGNLSAGSIIGFWPTSIMTQVCCVMLFFSVGVKNETFQALAYKLIYRGRNFAPLIPVLLYLSILIVAGTGTGGNAVYFMTLPIYLIAKQCKMKMGFFPLIVIAGINGGGWMVFSMEGALNNGILASSGFTSEMALSIASKSGIHFLLTSLIMFVVGYIVFQGWKCEAIITEKPKPFTKEQRWTLSLVVTFVLLYLLPTILGNFTDNAIVSMIVSKVNLYMLACVFALICLALKLIRFEDMVKGVPWNALLTVCGMGTFIAVCNQLGMVDFLTNLFHNNIDASIMPAFFAICAGIMSLFSATMGVVLPTFYPILNSLMVSSGISPYAMASSIAIGSAMSGISPFSNMGAVTYSVVKEEDKKTVFIAAIATIGLAWIVVQACILLGVYNI